jgi:hypothetical protein
MTLAIQQSFGIPKQRSFWLRCFLGGGIPFAALFRGFEKARALLAAASEKLDALKGHDFSRADTDRKNRGFSR